MSTYQKISQWVSDLESGLNEMRARKAAAESRLNHKISHLVDEATSNKFWDAAERVDAIKRLDRFATMVASEDATTTTLQHVEKELDRVYGDLSLPMTLSNKTANREILRGSAGYGGHEVWFQSGRQKLHISMQKPLGFDDDFNVQGKVRRGTSNMPDFQGNVWVRQTDVDELKIENDDAELLIRVAGGLSKLEEAMEDETRAVGLLKRKKDASWSDFSETESFEDDGVFIDEADSLDLTVDGPYDHDVPKQLDPNYDGYDSPDERVSSNWWE